MCVHAVLFCLNICIHARDFSLSELLGFQSTSQSQKSDAIYFLHFNLCCNYWDTRKMDSPDGMQILTFVTSFVQNLPQKNTLNRRRPIKCEWQHVLWPFKLSLIHALRAHYLNTLTRTEAVCLCSFVAVMNVALRGNGICLGGLEERWTWPSRVREKLQ